MGADMLLTVVKAPDADDDTIKKRIEAKGEQECRRAVEAWYGLDYDEYYEGDGTSAVERCKHMFDLLGNNRLVAELVIDGHSYLGTGGPSWGDILEEADALGILNELQVFTDDGWDNPEPSNVWEDNNIQFPRLLAEIWYTQEIDYDELCDSMDLTDEQVDELFDRARTIWETHLEKM